MENTTKNIRERKRLGLASFVDANLQGRQVWWNLARKMIATKSKDKERAQLSQVRGDRSKERVVKQLQVLEARHVSYLSGNGRCKSIFRES